MICKKCENSIIEELIKKDKENALIKEEGNILEYLSNEAVLNYSEPFIEVPYLEGGSKYWLTEHITAKFCCNCGSEIKENSNTTTQYKS